MENSLFRKKSLERVSSPEQLNEYLRVCNPGVWMVMVAVILLLIGAIVWGIFGRLDSTLQTVVVSDGTGASAYVRVEDRDKIMGKTLTVNGVQCTVTSENFSGTPIPVDEAFDEYALFVGGLQRGEWVYAVALDLTMADGIYEATIVTDSVSPVSFVMN